MLLYLVRHAQTELNQEGIVQGTLDPSLSATGKEQAQKLAEWLRLVPLTQVWSSPLARAQETAKAIVAVQPRNPKLRTDDRLTTRHWGDAQGKQWDEVCHDFDKYGIESEQSVEDRLHSFLSVLLTSHTPASSATATPATPGFTSASGKTTPLTPGLASVSMNNAPIFDRAFSFSAIEKPGTVSGLPRPGMPRTPTTPAVFGKGSGVVLVVTHQECLSAFLRILTTPSPVLEGLDAKKPPIDLHVPETIDFKHVEGEGKEKGQVGNTSVAILRIWWEDEGDGQLEPRGRLEAWGSEEHLHENEGENQ